MSRPAEPNAGFAAPERSAEDRWLEARGYMRCEHCGQLLPLIVSRCRRRRCPAYAPMWARDTMRKIRVNLQTYGGLSCVVAVTAPGEEAGLIWDRCKCRHTAGERCSGPRGCRVVEKAAAIWNEGSRGWWRELNRLCKQRADRAIRRLGAETKCGVLMYEWELQKRGVWHLHVVLGMETAIERVWAYEYVAALSELAESKGFGWVDRRPLRAPHRPSRRRIT